MANLPFDQSKKIIAVWEDGVYVRWRYADGKEEGAYNMLYETDFGIRSLKTILEDEMGRDQLGNVN